MLAILSGRILSMLRLLLIITLFPSSTIYGQDFFKDISESTLKNAGHNRVIVPVKYRVLSLDSMALLSFLKNLPSEKNLLDRNTAAPVIQLPMPGGGINRFYVWESTTMEPELAAKFPELRTYTGQGIDDRTATLKLDWTLLGFHAMISSGTMGSVFIDPYAQDTKTAYISYYKDDVKKRKVYRKKPVKKTDKTL